MAIEAPIRSRRTSSSTLEVEIRRDLETYVLSLQGVANRLKMPELDTLSPKLRAAVLFEIPRVRRNTARSW